MRGRTPRLLHKRQQTDEEELFHAKQQAEKDFMHTKQDSDEEVNHEEHIIDKACDVVQLMGDWRTLPSEQWSKMYANFNCSHGTGERKSDLDSLIERVLQPILEKQEQRMNEFISKLRVDFSPD